MQRIDSKIDTRSELFAANRGYHENLIAEFRERQDAARHSRPERDIERLKRQDKLLVRERLELLLDPGTPFWEFSTLAANDLYDGDSPGASVVTGIGVVSGVPVERLYREIRALRIYEGTSEVQKLVIAGQLLANAKKSGWS